MNLDKFYFMLCLLLLISNSTVSAYVWPTVSKEITSDFGPRDIGEGWDWHSGIDIHASIGTEVYAVAEGTVSRIDNVNDSEAGLWIEIDHGGMRSRYLHLSEIKVSENDVVSAGQLIGKSGNTAWPNPVDPHLHFDFGYSKDNGIHPLKYLPYNDTGPPPITNIEPTVYENGDFMILKAVVGIKAEVDTTADKDLNEVKFYVDGE